MKNKKKINEMNEKNLYKILKFFYPNYKWVYGKKS